MSYQPNPVKIYTDGACHNGTSGCGGWAMMALVDGAKIALSGHACKTTNNRMELVAAITAVEYAPDDCDVEIISDSKYVVETINSGWAKHKNTDLWFDMNQALAKKPGVSFHWVRGHSGDQYNEIVDTLAVNASNMSCPGV